MSWEKERACVVCRDLGGFSSALAARGSLSFYRPRRGRFTSMPHCSATGGGMACSAGEFAAVLAALAPVLSSWRVPYLNRGGFEGEGVVVGCGVLRRARRSRCRRSVRGKVAGVAASSPRVLNSAGVVIAVPGVALQWRGWHSHRLTSQFDPADSRGKGSRVRPAPLRGCGALAVQEWAAQCHGGDTGHVAQSPIVAGMGSP
jgi:hypothetical protein